MKPQTSRDVPTDSSAIADFLESYPTPQQARKILWELLIAAMGSRHADMWTQEVRANMVFFTEQCGELIEAMHVEFKPQLNL